MNTFGRDRVNDRTAYFNFKRARLSRLAAVLSEGANG